MKRKNVITSLCAAAVFFAFISNANSIVYQIDWTIVKHAATSFTASAMDALLMDGNSRVSLYDYSCTSNATQADIPCALKLARNGSIGTFGTSTDGLNIIDNQADEDAVFNANPGKVIIVDQVNYCDGVTSVFLIGCGEQPGNTFVVEKDVNIDVFIHEYGHNKDLDHRDTCIEAIMHSDSPETNGLIESECTAMGGKKYTTLSSTGGTSPLHVNDEPYWAKTSIVVPSTQTLTIGPNVNIQFNAGVSIKGKLYADGRSGPIRLYSNCSDANPCPRVYP